VGQTPAALRDIFLNPVIAVIITLALVALCTWWISWLTVFSGHDHPYTILYLVPVAVGAAFLGVRGGIMATILVLVVTRVWLLNDHRVPDVNEGLDFMTLTMGTLAIAAVTGRLRSTLTELRTSNDRLELANVNLGAANLQLIESERLRRDFNRDVLLAVTNGKLRLVDREDIPGVLLGMRDPGMVRELHDPVDATTLRQSLQALTAGFFAEEGRGADLLMSVTEAATNAIKHGNGGEAKVWVVDETVSVMIVDHGEGIAPTHLARATLEKGYSTRISLGMGFHLMLETSDVLSLSTGPDGTAVLIQVSNCPRGSEGDQVLARYLKE
jgi:anti-sigma regulatory factor (Ser/Thr protein kinase)